MNIVRFSLLTVALQQVLPIPIILVISLVAALGANIVKKYYTNTTNKGLCSVFFFNALSGGIASVVFLLWGGLGSVSPLTVWLGVIFGLTITIQSMANMLALQTGPMALTTVIVSFSTVITALSGALFWNEELSLLQILGIGLMLASFIFSVEKKSNEKKASLKWFALCLVALISTGGIGLLQRIHQNSSVKSELNAFLFIAFILSSILSFAFYLLMKRKEGDLFPEKQSKKRFWWLFALIILMGTFNAANNKLNLYLSGVMDSAVFFPIVNGGGLVLATLAALFIFKERLTKKQWIGVALGIVSVLCLCV